MFRESTHTDAHGHRNLAVGSANRVANRLGRYTVSQPFGDGQRTRYAQAMQDDCELFASHARQQVTVPAVLP